MAAKKIRGQKPLIISPIPGAFLSGNAELNLFFNISHGFFKLLIGIHQVTNGLAGVDHGAVIAASKVTANYLQ